MKRRSVHITALHILNYAQEMTALRVPGSSAGCSTWRFTIHNKRIFYLFFIWLINTICKFYRQKLIFLCLYNNVKLVTRRSATAIRQYPMGSQNAPLYISMLHLCQSVNSTTARPTEGAVCSVSRGSNPVRGNRFICFQIQPNLFWATRQINSVSMPGLCPRSLRHFA